jgi:hypothetical protein
VGYRATVTVTVDGVQRGDVGYGDAMEYNGSRITPHELASKEAVSDALKRCLSSWGDQFGLVLYGADPAPQPELEVPADPPAEKKSPRSAPSPAAAAQKPEPTPGSTAQRADRRLVRPPYVHVKRTKTAGWQIVYVCKSGKPEITKRRLEFGEALTSGAALARIHECPLEVDR